jgi:hypothetical protein
MTGRIPPFFFLTKKMLLMKLGGGGSKGTSSMAPFSSRAATSTSIKGLFAPCDGVKKQTPGQAIGEEDCKEGVHNLRGFPHAGVLHPLDDWGFLPQSGVHQLAAQDERQAASARSVCPKDGFLEGL